MLGRFLGHARRWQWFLSEELEREDTYKCADGRSHAISDSHYSILSQKFANVAETSVCISGQNVSIHNPVPVQ
jgi:hypothetical protein